MECTRQKDASPNASAVALTFRIPGVFHPVLSGHTLELGRLRADVVHILIFISPSRAAAQ